MAMHGADIEQLRQLATSMDNAASQLDRIVFSLGISLGAAHWSGNDAGQFRSSWVQTYRPKLKQSATALRSACTILRRNADEQEHASAARGSGGVADRGRGLAPSTSANPEGFTEPRGGKYGMDRDMLDLAFACGAPYSGPERDGKVPAGWQEVSRDELGRLGIDRDILGREGESFSATLYVDKNGNYVLAYEGTDFSDGRDVAADVASAAVTSDQVLRAIRVSQEVKTKLMANGVDEHALKFTGYSLGGELATASAIATGNDAVTFNTKGLSLVSIGIAEQARNLDNMQHNDRSSDRASVTAYVSSVDPLNNAQDAGIIPPAYGRVVRLDGEQYANPDQYLVDGVEALKFHHGKVPLAGAFDRMVVDEEAWY